MLRNLVWLSIIIASSVIATGCGREPQNTALLNPESDKEFRVSIPLQDTFYDHDLFVKGVSSANITDYTGLSARIIVVPHHLLASEIIAKLFVVANKQPIDTIVIIGPNHDDKNASTIATAHLKWQTPLGEVKTDNNLVASLLASTKTHALPEAFVYEHSIGAIMPFVRQYFPDASVVPIMFNSTATLGDAERVAQWLTKNLDEKSLVIVSTDFSHYLTEQEANKNDKTTEQFILGDAVEKIMALNNDYIDSPASIVSAMVYARTNNLKPKMVHHANSNDFSERPFAETTSYFGIAFTEQ